MMMFTLHSLRKVGFAAALVVLLSIAFTQALQAQGVGIKLGIVSPKVYDSTIFFGLTFDRGVDTFIEKYLPGFEMPSLKGETSIEYWSADAGTDNLLFGITLRTLGFNTSARYHFSTGSNLSPFVGVGLSFIVTTFDFGNEIGGISTTNFDLGIHGMGGIDIPLGGSLLLRPQVKYEVGGIDNLQIGAAIVFGAR